MVMRPDKMGKPGSKAFLARRAGRIGRGTLVGCLIGVVSGLGGIVFNFLLESATKFFTLDLIRFLLPSHMIDAIWWGYPATRWILILMPALGGLISGFLVFRFAPEAEGHGTDAMIDSFHRKGGIVRRRVPLVKTIASAITIPPFR
jgi:chloride channel protein, CIC family